MFKKYTHAASPLYFILSSSILGISSSCFLSSIFSPSAAPSSATSSALDRVSQNELDSKGTDIEPSLNKETLAIEPQLKRKRNKGQEDQNQEDQQEDEGIVIEEEIDEEETDESQDLNSANAKKEEITPEKPAGFNIDDYISGSKSSESYAPTSTCSAYAQLCGYGTNACKFVQDFIGSDKARSGTPEDEVKANMVMKYLFLNYGPSKVGNLDQFLKDKNKTNEQAFDALFHLAVEAGVLPSTYLGGRKAYDDIEALQKANTGDGKTEGASTVSWENIINEVKA